MEAKTKILEGIRVLEFGWAVVGPLTCSWLGGYGAEVIKVETQTRPDIIRSMTPFVRDKFHIDNSIFFGRENASKYSVSLNLKHPEGLALARRLAAVSDIVLDSYTAGVMDKYGLGYGDLRRINPGLIMLSSCMYGQTGALRAMPGYGVPLTAVSGLTYLCGWPDRQPCGPYGAYTDYVVPRFNMLALAAALDHRRRTGQGVFIDASQFEASVQFMAPALLDHHANGRTAQRMGNASPEAAPHGVYPCAGRDAWCAIAVTDQDEWAGFRQALGDPDWCREERFANPAGRKAAEAELDALVSAWTASRQAREVMDVMGRHGVPAGVLNTGQDLGEDPQLRHDGYYHALTHPVMGQVEYPEHAIDFSEASQEVWRSPCLGEHTELICKKVLGLNDQEFARLQADNVFT